MLPTLRKHQVCGIKPRKAICRTPSRHVHITDVETNENVKPIKPPGGDNIRRKQRKAELEGLRVSHKAANAEAKASGLATDWTLKCGIIVERPQVIVPEREEWLESYESFYAKWNRPILAQIPPLQILDEDISELKGKEKEKEKEKEKDAGKSKEAETEEAKLSNDQEPGVELKYSRFTEADAKNDIRSVYRCLDKKLFLIVKKNRNDHAWQFPQGSLLPDELLKAGAERVFKSECNSGGNSLSTYFVGNGPVYFHRYKYNPNIQKTLNTYGAKVFFMYSYYLDGNVKLDEKHLVDYAWVTKPELPQYLSPDLYQAMQNSIPDDGKLETRKKSMPNHEEPKHIAKGSAKKKKK